MKIFQTLTGIVFAVVVVFGGLFFSGEQVYGSTGLEKSLIAAAKSGDVKRIQVLLDQGVDVNVIDGDDRMTPLMVAARNGNVEVLRLLLDKGSKVDAKDRLGRTALMVADKVDIVRVLLDKGAGVNAKDEFGGTALRAAACRGYSRIVQMLLNSGADVNATAESGGTALMCAVQADDEGVFQGDVETVKVLLNKGADVNAKEFTDTISKTALMIAASGGNLQIVKLLLGHGADVNAKDKSGKTVLMYAAIPEIKNLLRSAGAKE